MSESCTKSEIQNLKKTKSQTDKIQNGQNFEFYQLRKYAVRIKRVLTDLS